jgi:hypothetical protein
MEIRALKYLSYQRGVRMSTSSVSLRMACIVLVVLSGYSLAHAGPPDSCKFLSTSDWSAAIGRPVTGGQISLVDNPQSTTSMCTYMAGGLFVVVTVNQLPTAEAAKKEFATQLDNSRSHDEGSQRTRVEAGLGESAFSAADRNSTALMALQGPRIINIGLVGAGAEAISHEQIRSLMHKALSHQ